MSSPSETESETDSESRHPTVQPGTTSLVAAPPPPAPSHDLTPEQLEFYIRAGIHHDRSPGNVLAVCHPLRFYKVPRGLLDALEEVGFSVTRVETDRDRLESVERIRDALRELSKDDRPLDVLAISGDGSLDHHLMVAAWWAFFPDLVEYRAGEIDCGAVTEEDLAGLPAAYREAFFAELPDGSALEPSEAQVTEIWLLRSALEGLLRKGKPVAKVLRKAGREADDLVLRIAVLATLVPHRVKLRPNGFDLSKLAFASREETFKGLYPHIRSICTYPAGTAADNAVAASVPGYIYGTFARLLGSLRILSPLRRWAERRVIRSFVEFYTRRAVVVPARLSVVALDGDWQRIGSHAAGGPGAGHFFSADLTKGTKGMRGYLSRIPKVIWKEGFLGSTIVRLRSRYADGREKSFTEAHMAEGIYTNRALLAGVASIPTTDSTSFGGQSSLCVIIPVWYIGKDGRRSIVLRGLAGFWEAIGQGLLARMLHLCGLGVGTLAGGGKLVSLLPEHQVAIKEEEAIEMEYLTLDKQPRAVAVQVSGDPFQTWRIDIRVFTGPIPLLGDRDSLLLASTRRALANLHLEHSYRLRAVYIGGVHYFRHVTGRVWSDAFAEETGLLRPPLHLARNLVRAQRRLLEAWQEAGAGDFVDTTRAGLGPFRRGRYAHNNDQSAHLLLLREPGATLLMREVRAQDGGAGEVYEARATYRRQAGSWLIHRSQILRWEAEEPPRILQEEHYFRDAEQFQQQAPTFFPVLARTPEEPTLLGGGEDDFDDTGEDVVVDWEQ